MTQYRKKPVIVEAVQFTGDNWTQIHRFVLNSDTHFLKERNGSLLIPTLEGEMEARPGDWIVKGIQGECYPVKPDIFAATYEPVS